jgi:GlcNAc-P-P-Und epimerase
MICEHHLKMGSSGQVETANIIGGSGFIGTRLATRLFNLGRSFLIIDKRPSRSFMDSCLHADVREVEALRATMSGGTVVNLAAEHRDDVRPLSLYEDVNVQGARNVCEVATEKGVRCIVFTSTVAVYGFAPPNTDESGAINPFNEYGRTKWGAEQVYREWYEADPANRTLVILRPTVVFGEQNRGNVYNLLRQIASGRFVMVGSGRNVKSMAYVENIAAFLEHSLSFAPGLYVYNYVDKPDFDMNALVATVRERLGAAKGVGFRLPYTLGLGAGYALDLAAWVTKRSFPISSIRVRKFCATTQFATSINETGFVAPVSLQEGLQRTLRHEFLEDHSDEQVYETE